MSEQGQAASSDPVRGFILLRGLIIAIPHDRRFILGRDKNSCDIALPDQRVSKKHIAIEYRESKYVVSDLSSANGTFLNGEKVTKSLTLMPGDELKVPPFSMMFIGPDQLSRPRAQAAEEDDTSHFRGELNTLKVVDLIQLINSTSQSGQLNLKAPQNKSAKMVFIDGEINHARAGQLEGENAVFSVLGFTEGHFDFVRGPQTPSPNPIQKRTQNLLFEGCQLQDENRMPEISAVPPSRKSTQPLDLKDLFNPAEK